MERALLPLKRDYNQVWHGFDRAQVLQYLDHVETNLRRVMADRDGAAARTAELSRELAGAQAEIIRLRDRVEELKKPPERLEDLDERMQRTVDLANARAEEIAERAQVAAEQHWTATTELSEQLRERYRKLLGKLESHAAALQTEQEHALKATKAEVFKLTTEAARRRTQLDIDAERKRRTVEHEFEQSMTTQRAALEKQVADERTASKDAAERRVAEATAEATRLVDEARAKAEKLVSDAMNTAERREGEANRKVQRLNALAEQAFVRVRKASELLTRHESFLDPLPAESSVDVSREAGPATPTSAVPPAPAAAKPTPPADATLPLATAATPPAVSSAAGKPNPNPTRLP